MSDIEKTIQEIHDSVFAEGVKKGREEFIDYLISEIESARYCKAERCPFFKKCNGWDECPISVKAEDIFCKWLKAEKEQKE